MSIGIIISGMITSACYFLIPFYIGFFAPGDIYSILGTILGCYFSFKYRKEQQTFIKLGIIIGVGGALLATVLISIVYAIIYLSLLAFSWAFLFHVLFYVLFGFITGYIMAIWYIRKEEKLASSPSTFKGFDLLEED